MSAAERLANLDAALAAAPSAARCSPQRQGPTIDWEQGLDTADPSVWLTRALSVRQLRALHHQHSTQSADCDAPAPADKPLVLLSLQELRTATLPLVGRLLWDPAYKAALGWAREALQELCDVQGLPHQGMAKEDMAQRVSWWYLSQKFELPASAAPPGFLGESTLGSGLSDVAAGAQQAEHSDHPGSPRHGGSRQRRAMPDGSEAPPQPASAGTPEDGLQGIELGSQLEVCREVIDEETGELVSDWFSATVEARIERLLNSDASQLFLLRYDADLELSTSVIDRAIVRFTDEGELEDVDEGVQRWRRARSASSSQSDAQSDSSTERDDATSDYLDARLGRSYAGPSDEAFRRDTLERAAMVLLQGENAGFFASCQKWEDVLEGLHLHHKVSPVQAAAHGAALLAGAVGRPPRRRELTALAAWLGLDREGLSASGTAADVAIEKEFQRDWDELKELRKRAEEEATVISLVAIGNAERLRALCADEGKDFTTADYVGWTPLHFAARLSRVDCLKVLLEAARQRCCESSFLDAKDWKGRTALCYALRLADETTVKELLRAGASCVTKDRQGCTPLHLALSAVTWHQQLWRLQLLLSEGRDVAVDALNRHGMSALHIAVDMKEEECIEVLLDGGADVNLRSKAGDTPLHIAIDFDGRKEIVQLLLDRGADASLRNDLGRTPAEYAADYGNQELEELLSQDTLLRRLQSGGSRGPRRLLSGLSSRNVPSAEPDIDEDNACVVCMRRGREVILAPCGHRHLCKTCTRAILTGPRGRRSCPICKEKIESFVSQVFD